MLIRHHYAGCLLMAYPRLSHQPQKLVFSCCFILNGSNSVILAGFPPSLPCATVYRFWLIFVFSFNQSFLISPASVMFLSFLGGCGKLFVYLHGTEEQIWVLIVCMCLSLTYLVISLRVGWQGWTCRRSSCHQYVLHNAGEPLFIFFLFMEGVKKTWVGNVHL